MHSIANIVRNNRGVALLITLSVISILVVTTLELNKKTRTSVYFSATARDRVTLSHMAMSGVHAAMALLIKDKENSDIDSVQEDWANPEKVSGLIADIPFEAGTLNVTITDELGKIQVNALVNFPESRQFNESQRELWDHFLNLVISPLERTEDTAPTPIINALKDWLDYGDDDATTGLSGAESDYYQDLDPPYSCKNGPMTHLGELPMIKGITPEFFEGVGGVPGIDAYMTVYGMTAAGAIDLPSRGPSISIPPIFPSSRQSCLLKMNCWRSRYLSTEAPCRMKPTPMICRARHGTKMRPGAAMWRLTRTSSPFRAICFKYIRRQPFAI